VKVGEFNQKTLKIAASNLSNVLKFEILSEPPLPLKPWASSDKQCGE